MKFVHSLLLVIVAVALFAASALAADVWKTYKSTKYGYRVRYPGSWYLFDPSFSFLEIVNFPPHKRVRGTVIPSGGAIISVSGIQGIRGVTNLDDWIKHDLNSNISLEQSVIPISDPSTDGCSELKRVVSMFDEGGKTFSVATHFYCLAKGQPYQIRVVNWKDDPQQPQYQNLALKMALSLRVDVAGK